MRNIKKMIVVSAALAVVLCACGTDKNQSIEVTTTEEAVTTAEAAQEESTTDEQSGEESKVVIDTVKTDDFSMDYCKFGTGDKIFVILPGLSVKSVMESAEAVADAYSMFGDDYTVYLFERKNDINESYSVNDMAKDTAEAMKQLGLEDVYLFGASQGGMIAMDLACDYPELVHKLIVSSTCVNPTEEKYYKEVEKWAELSRDKKGEELCLEFGEKVYPKETFEQIKDVLTDMGKTVTDEEYTRFAILAESIKEFDDSKKLDNIKCPVLAIGDKTDQIFGAESAEYIGELLKDKEGCETYIYDGFGHAVYDMAPDFKDRMMEFYNK